jgi:hypothetical protein
MIRTVEIVIPETAGAIGQVDALAMCQSAAAEARNYAENAAQWLTGAGAPSSGLGVENQLYLDTDSGDMWKRGAVAWDLIAQLTPDLAPTIAAAAAAQAAADAAQDDADTANAAIAALVIPVAGSGASQVPTNAVADGKYAAKTATEAHIASTSNPHSVTKAQVGLTNVTDTAQMPASYLDTDTALAANSDAKVPSQKAVKAYIDGQQYGMTPMQTMFWSF